MSATMPQRMHRLNPDGTLAGANKKSVWRVATVQKKTAHTATFPPKLIEPCILAGTSAIGCCAFCGAPYARITEKPTYQKVKYAGKYAETSNDIKGTSLIASTRGARLLGKGAGHDNPFPFKKQIGWRKTCACMLSNEIVPCVVLDPFMGSGTTAEVALKHNRYFVGCELNEHYIHDAVKDLNQFWYAKLPAKREKEERCRLRLMKKTTSALRPEPSKTTKK